jgi:NAD(P)-dependent dehydrogenase (short-subunit alcohol dehydrogenase family)
MTAPSTSRVALVTGAGTGIGLATCALLAKAGFQVLLVGRREAVLRKAAEQLGGPSAAQVHAADVGDYDQAAACVDRAIETFGRLDAVINNAGHVESMPMGGGDESRTRRLFDVNAIGPAAIINRAWPRMIAQKSGRIINVSSMAAVDPFPGLGVYAAAKAAVNLLARAAHNEGRRWGILAFAVAPGAVETAMLRSIADERALPPARTLQPDHVARIIVECATGARDEQSGQVIAVPSP